MAVNLFQVPSAFPYLEEHTHRHGITVTPRVKSGHQCTTTGDDHEVNPLVLPKTYITRKGTAYNRNLSYFKSM